MGLLVPAIYKAVHRGHNALGCCWLHLVRSNSERPESEGLAGPINMARLCDCVRIKNRDPDSVVQTLFVPVS